MASSITSPSVQRAGHGTSSRIFELDGLRAIAILLVVGCHYPGFAGRLWRLPEFGWIGVDIFFALSGYLITTILLGLRGRRTPYRTFYSRRFIRILPPYLATTLFLLVIAFREHWHIGNFLASQLLFLQGIPESTRDFFMQFIRYPWYHLTHSPSLLANAHALPLGSSGTRMDYAYVPPTYWSLSIEEYFYLLWAPIVLRCSLRTILRIAVAVCILEMVIRWIVGTDMAYFSLPCRFDALLYGALLAILFDEWRRADPPMGRFVVHVLVFGLLCRHRVDSVCRAPHPRARDPSVRAFYGLRHLAHLHRLLCLDGAASPACGWPVVARAHPSNQGAPVYRHHQLHHVSRSHNCRDYRLEGGRCHPCASARGGPCLPADHPDGLLVLALAGKAAAPLERSPLPQCPASRRTHTELVRAIPSPKIQRIDTQLRYLVRMLLSFVVPAYNEEAYLGACLESILHQTRGLEHLTEIIVVNNASTDSTREIALSYPGVRLVDESRKGLPFARQAGFLASTGSLIANVDADSRLTPGWVEKVLTTFREHEGGERPLVSLSGPLVYYDLTPRQSRLVNVFYGIAWLTYATNKYILRVGSMVQGGNFVSLAQRSRPSEATTPPSPSTARTPTSRAACTPSARCSSLLI